MSNIYLFFKLKRSYLEHFKFTAFFSKGDIRIRGDRCHLIEIFNDFERRMLINVQFENPNSSVIHDPFDFKHKKTCQKIDRFIWSK